MTPERWRQVTRIYGAVLTKAPDVRAAALLELCPDDEALRKEVESLLADGSTDALRDQLLGEVASVLVDQDLSGRTLGPYRLESSIGAGGMGQVYRANDTRLHRTVAIKVLAPSLAHDSQFRARFDREAKAIAALNHPHICTLHDIGSSDGIDYLVMEYVEGETLSARLERGAFPFDQALTTAIQIAEALAAAHRQGIVHRDLKPGNVMLTKSGVKLLDFGLAKPSQSATMAGPMSMLPTTPPMGPTRGAPLTVQGTILGTLQYMAPEQLEGKEADARTDLFAFGAIVYEMFTGKRAFSGTSQASLIGAIMHAEPPSMSADQPLTPLSLERIVRTCLAKDPDQRWQSAVDLARELRGVGENREAERTLAVARESKSISGRERAAWMLALAAGIAAVGFLVSRQRSVSKTDNTQSVVRSVISVPEGLDFSGAPPSRVVLSPDGRQLVFPAMGLDRVPALWIRSLDGISARRLENTDGVNGAPFWSPDSRFIAFLEDGKLKKIDPAGGPALTIVTDPSGLQRGSNFALLGGTGTWNQNGVILLAVPNGATSNIFRTSVAGDMPVQLSPRGDQPTFLPDGSHFTYRTGGDEDAKLFVASLDGGEPRQLLQGVSQPRYARGHLLYSKDRTLFAQRFDEARLTVVGDPIPIATDVLTGRAGNSAFAASSNLIAYISDRDSPSLSQLMWFDRTGKPLVTFSEKRDYRSLTLSHDGNRIVASVLGPGDAVSDLWLIDSQRGSGQKLTSTRNDGEETAIWSRDDSQILFGLIGGLDRRGLYVRPSSGAGEAKRFSTHEEINGGNYQVQSWSSDERYVVFGNGPGSKLWILRVDDNSKPMPFMQSPVRATRAQFSPDGQWIAYQSPESGRDEVYITPFPGRPGNTSKVSTDSGGWPRWSRNGQELFYLSGDLTLMAAAIKRRGDDLQPDAAHPLFATTAKTATDYLGWPYDVSSDGRFLFNMNTERPAAATIRLITNWPALLKE